MTTYTGYLEGPIWGSVKKPLYHGAALHHLQLEILDEDRGWLQRVIYFRLHGEKTNINECLITLKNLINKYNGRI